MAKKGKGKMTGNQGTPQSLPPARKTYRGGAGNPKGWMKKGC